MKRMLGLVLVMVLLASAMPLVVMPAVAYEKKIPCDDGDNELTKDELVNAILPYMLDEGEYSLDDVGDASWVYAYWDGELKTIVDQADRTVTFYRPLERIIPLSSYVTEVIRSLKATDKIVGVIGDLAKKKIFFQELADLPSVGGGYGGIYDYEKIVGLQPEVVFVYGEERSDEVADKIESIAPSVTVVRMSCSYMGCKPDVYNDYVRKLGYILDREEEAGDLFDFQEECLDQIKEKVETLSDDKPRVFYTLPSFFPTRYSTVNRLNVIHEAIVSAGGINIAADIGTDTSGSPDVNSEWVIEQNPDIIIAGTSVIDYRTDKPTEAEMEDVRDIIMNHPGWENISAVNSDKVYLLGQRLFSSTHHSVGPAYLAKCFNSTLFGDLDPKALHQEYLTRFQGLDIDLDKQGVFVYPEETI